jgi:hypothetical protein
MLCKEIVSIHWNTASCARKSKVSTLDLGGVLVCTDPK